MTDRDKFMAALARASVGQIPVLDQATHERVARAAVAANPDLARHALETGDYIPIVKAAEKLGSGQLVTFWLAQRIGQLVREQAAETPDLIPLVALQTWLSDEAIARIDRFYGPERRAQQVDIELAAVGLMADWEVFDEGPVLTMIRVKDGGEPPR